jgi:hypothetical protein
MHTQTRTCFCSRALKSACVWNTAGRCSSTNSSRSSTKPRATSGHLSQLGGWPALRWCVAVFLRQPGKVRVHTGARTGGAAAACTCTLLPPPAHMPCRSCSSSMATATRPLLLPVAPPAPPAATNSALPPLPPPAAAAAAAAAATSHSVWSNTSATAWRTVAEAVRSTVADARFWQYKRKHSESSCAAPSCTAARHTWARQPPTWWPCSRLHKTTHARMHTHKPHGTKQACTDRVKAHVHTGAHARGPHHAPCCPPRAGPATT